MVTLFWFEFLQAIHRKHFIPRNLEHESLKSMNV
jgi:hypothetical protein